MKNKLSRVLVLLLAIAMMIPSFAMAADETPSLKLGEVTKIEKNLIKGESTWDSSVQVEYTVPKGSVNPEIWWTSSDTTVAQPETKTYPGIGTGTQRVYVQLKGAGSATITGTLHLDNAATTYTVSFPVTLKAVDVKDIRFTEGATKKVTVGKDGGWATYLDDVEVLLEDGGSTYYDGNKFDIRFRVTAGNDVAYVSNASNGRLTFIKPGTVTMEVYIPGSGICDSITVTGIADEDDPERPETPGYTSLTFTAQGKQLYTITDNSLDLGGYGYSYYWDSEIQDYQRGFVERFLTRIPEDAEDSLFWTCSDPTIATVDSTGFVQFDDHNYGTVHITVMSAKDNSVKAECDVERIKKEDLEKPYTKLGFKPATITRRADKNEDGDYISFNVDEYLTIREPKGATDDLVWVSSDSSVAKVDNDGWVTPRKDEGTVTITARSKKDAKVVSDPALVITFVKAAEHPITALSFSEVPEIKKDTNDYVEVDLKDYLTSTPKLDESDDTLTWKSDDETVAYVTEEGILWALGAGTANIKVYNADGSATATVKIVVTEVDDPYSSFKFKEESLTAKLSDEEIKLDPDYLVSTGNEDGWHDSKIWTSSNQQIALVNDGVVTLLDAGEVTITVRSEKDAKVTASIKLVIAKEDTPITAITLTQSEFTMKADDAMFLGRYVVTDPAIEDTDDYLVYTTDDTNIVIVEQDGNFRCIAGLMNPGVAHVTVRSALNPEVKAQFTINLVPADELKGIAFVDAPKTLTQYADPVCLEDYVVTDPVDYSGELYFNSSDPQVATIDGEGWIEWQKPGKATFTVSNASGSVWAQYEMEMVAAKPVKEISLKDITLQAGGDWVHMGSFNDNFCAFWPYDADGVDWSKVRWTVADRNIAEAQWDNEIGVPGYDEEDRLTHGWLIVGYKPGTTTLTVTAENYDGSVVTASCTVTVIGKPLESIVMPTEKVSLKLYAKTYDTVRFNLNPYDAFIDDGELIAVSNDASVAEVTDLYFGDGKGNVEFAAKKPGKAWISIKRTSDDVTLGAFKVVVGTTKVKRISVPKKSITLNWYDDGLTVKSNRTYQNSYMLETTVSPWNAYYTISYKTTDPSVAFVRDQRSLDPDGNHKEVAEIVAAGVGTATITVTVDDGYKVRTAKVKVNVEGKAPELAIDQKKATIDMTAGEKSIKLKAFNAETDEKVNVTWTSSNPKVAKVSKSGKVTALAAGKTTITATHEASGKKVTCKVTVKSDVKVIEVKKIKGPSKVTIKKGEKKTLNIKVKPSGATVTFTSSDPKIVTVDKNGKIKGKKAGKATITVSGDGVTLKIKVTVK